MHNGVRRVTDRPTLAAKGEPGRAPVEMEEMLSDDDLDQLCDQAIEDINAQTAAKYSAIYVGQNRCVFRNVTSAGAAL